ncbi:MAG TPA: error-prone DNA polymerase [Polaromonas sp.]|uniref:error-prone DNA polymerase n=1 Tax=Polaromonas sp. TaxID=1869339 RepID=UPI002D5999DE|nr:error-prone DNA polymerase [Polaromonas sp.]HYW57238.1 error-prone DNA polymerase [Polaromonas sp.]
MQPIPPKLPAYAELHALSNFSFQRGASHAEELVERAHDLGYTALAITDECSVAGVVRAHVAAKKCGLQLLPGAEFLVQASSGPPFRLVALVNNLQGWGNLCEFITAARREAPGGEYQVSQDACDFSLLADCEVLLTPIRGSDAINTEALCARAYWAKSQFGTKAWLAVELLHGLDDELHLQQLEQVAQLTGVPLVAAGNVLMHVRSRKPLQDVITAVRLGQPVQNCGFALQANAEAHLRPRMRLATLYGPALMDATLEVARRCHFSLDEIAYQYPLETVPAGQTPAEALAGLTWQGAQQRYPQGMPDTVRQQVLHELAIISDLKYEMYFLTVHDIVRFAREQAILCQGRGSAANSAVCYCLGITAVNPENGNLLFERFMSRERNEPPDIDVDFEHERREEVIQYIYGKYGRDRAAIAATVISYRPRSALRDVGKALGMPPDLIARFAGEHFWFDSKEHLGQRLIEAGLPPDDGRVLQWLELTQQLIGFPRHLSQHVGGFVLTQGRLTRLVPVQNAAMPDRSIIQWDKDDLDAMGLLKVDVLALGMLSAIRRCIDFVNGWRGTALALHTIKQDCVATYDMICAADTVGVFQIESRAQMSMLPRLKPRCYYDLVIEVAIVRPGPIQGGMVHPYLKNRSLPPDQVPYPSEALREVLKRTLGVPIFQEQVMQIAMVAASFSPDEADGLRRSMAAWKRKGGVGKYRDKLISGMQANGYTTEFAESIYRQIQGFGEYGFPESHAASFALLVYISCWLKCHEPACFLAALLNAQPLGFYPPSQLVQDARRHQVEVRAVDVLTSDWDCTLEAISLSSQPAVRLGLRLVSGLGEAAGQRIVAARVASLPVSIEDLALRAQLDTKALNALASADALASLAGHRRQQVWQASALTLQPALLQQAPTHEEPLALAPAREGEEILFDYRATGLTLRRHPVALLRPRLAKMDLLNADQLRLLPHGQQVAACGIVTVRQQPQTAKGTIFITLEDETGPVNVIVWKSLREKQRKEVLHARLLAVYGEWQRDVESGGKVQHLIAHRLEDLSPLLGRLGTESRDFH